MRRHLRWAAALLLAGCAGGGAAPAPGAAGSSARPLTVDHEAGLVFQADWNTVQKSLPIMAGGRLRVDYDSMRLPSCRATYNGLQTWDIVLNWRALPDATVRTTALPRQAGPLTVVFPLPETAEELELWFVNTDRTGCRAVDSNLGANYRFPVAKPGRLTEVAFASDWTEGAAGPIERGGLMRLVYAPERLRACRGTYHGGRMWNIYAGWRFLPGGQTGSTALYDGEYFAGEAAITRPDVHVPPDAEAVELWFSNSDYFGCSAWDSNFGQNYRFDIVPEGAQAPAVRWGGDFDFVLFHRSEQHLGDVDPAYYFDTMAGAELAASVELQIWAPGLTDRPYDEAGLRAAAARVSAKAVTDALPVAPGVWGERDLRFVGRRGNNFVYAFDLLPLRGPGTVVPDGLYRWFARFSVDGGGTTEVGRDRFSSRRFVLAARQDAASCALFPDHAPQGCPQARAIGWAGSWGGRFTHACDHVSGLADPVVFAKSGAGHDCMTVDAEVWVPGLTERDGDPAGVLAQVETDLGYSGGPLAQPATYPLRFDGRVGNNYRFRWDAGEHVGRADRGDYRFRFRFSGDNGATWYVIGKADGPTGGDWRRLLVRNDSSDVPTPSHCDDVQLWQGATNSFPACFNYDVGQNFDATNCEFYLNALGDGSLGHNGASASWIEAYLKVGPQQGSLLNVGMLTRHREGTALRELTTLGTQIEPGYWLAGVTRARTVPGGQSFSLDVADFAFFVDVRRPDGAVVRLWQSNGGANFTLAQAFPAGSHPPYEKSIGVGVIRYANEALPMFDQKRACAP